MSLGFYKYCLGKIAIPIFFLKRKKGYWKALFCFHASDLMNILFSCCTLIILTPPLTWGQWLNTIQISICSSTPLFPCLLSPVHHTILTTSILSFLPLSPLSSFIDSLWGSHLLLLLSPCLLLPSTTKENTWSCDVFACDNDASFPPDSLLGYNGVCVCVCRLNALPL